MIHGLSIWMWILIGLLYLAVDWIGGMITQALFGGGGFLVESVVTAVQRRRAGRRRD